MRIPSLVNALSALLFVVTAATPARGSVISITPGDLAGATLIDFQTGLPGSSIDGQTFSGVTFSYLVSGVHSSDAILDGGPGLTNNITPLNVVNLNLGGNANSVLSLVFPTLEHRLGYGYAILSGANVANATSVSLFDASNTLVGTLSANGSPDPVFTGGFLGLQSDLGFARADVTFSSSGLAFAFDNLRFSETSAPVPEPATMTLFGVAICGVFLWGLRHRSSIT